MRSIDQFPSIGDRAGVTDRRCEAESRRCQARGNFHPRTVTVLMAPPFLSPMAARAVLPGERVKCNMTAFSLLDVFVFNGNVLQHCKGKVVLALGRM
jgi:hypothetical protein